MKTIPAILYVWMIVLLIPYAYTQFCVTYDDVYGWDYAAYVHAALYVADGASPYNESLYIYPPTLAILIVPFTYLSRDTGFAVWTVVSLIAYIYAVSRAVKCGTKTRVTSHD